MIYRIENIENDDLIGQILGEMEENLRAHVDENIRVEEVIREKGNSKGVDIQAIILLVKQGIKAIPPGVESVALSIMAAAIYDLMKSLILKHRHLKEFSPEKKIKVEITDDEGRQSTVLVTLEEILKK